MEKDPSSDSKAGLSSYHLVGSHLLDLKLPEGAASLHPQIYDHYEFLYGREPELARSPAGTPLGHYGCSRRSNAGNLHAECSWSGTKSRTTNSTFLKGAHRHGARHWSSDSATDENFLLGSELVLVSRS